MSDREDRNDGGHETPGPRDGGAAEEITLPEPDPDRSAEETIKVQLAALATNDDPHPDAGVETVYRFAAPALLETVGGSLDGLRQFLTGPTHATLIDHRDTRRGRLRIDDGVARENVVVTDAEGEDATYEFTLVEVEDDDGACWRTAEVELTYVGERPDHQHMPNVEFDGVEVKCEEGELLRNVLLRARGVSPHDRGTQYANCNGRGLCGTCAVRILEGEVTEPTARERRRLRLPPHDADERRRLSCQARVCSDLVVDEHERAWNRHLEEYPTRTDDPGEPIQHRYQGRDGTASGSGGDRSQ
jgi:ferredoxin